MAGEREVLSRLVEDHRGAVACARRLAVAASVSFTYGSVLRELAVINRRLEGGCRQMAVLHRGDARWLLQARLYSEVQRRAEGLARVRAAPPVVAPGALPLARRWARLVELYDRLAKRIEGLAERRTGKPGTVILPVSGDA